jgi:hypothetical protein
MMNALPLSASLDVKPATVRAFWAFMTDRYRTTVKAKADAVEMVALAQVLQQMGIVSADGFLRQYATTLGRRIYLPFVPGEGADLWSQIVVGVHEHQHVEQLDRESVAFLWNYATRPAKRTLYEAEAYRSNMELSFWRTGQVPSPAALAATLRAYGVSETDVKVAEKALAISAVAVRAGGVANGASKVAIEWLNANAPELRHAAA